MMRLALKSWLLLLYFDFIMRFRDFNHLHDIIRNQKIEPVTSGHTPSHAVLCHAIDLACVFYFKQVLCLQCSAATTVLLRQYGCDAQMVIGAQVLPFKSHAWVEVEGVVVNDKPYMLDIYQVMERC